MNIVCTEQEQEFYNKAWYFACQLSNIPKRWEQIAFVFSLYRSHDYLRKKIFLLNHRNFLKKTLTKRPRKNLTLIRKHQAFAFWYIWSKMLSSSQYTMLKLFKTTYPNKLFANDCVTLYLHTDRQTDYLSHRISSKRIKIFNRCMRFLKIIPNFTFKSE